MDIFDLFKKLESEKPSAGGPVTYIVAGLGNVGAEYEGTRHNAGFIALDAVLSSLGLTCDRARFSALTTEGTLGGARVLFMKPTTYMNLSGNAIGEAARFYKIPPEHVIVLCDEISFAPGRMRIRRKGSAGGHNGLKSIIASLGSEDFPRIRIGVGQKPTPEYDLADWVLGKFPKADREALDKAASVLPDALSLIIGGKIEDAMTKYSK